MRIIARPVKTIAVFERDGSPPVPYKFKYEGDDGSLITIRVDRVIYTHRSRIAGIESIIYACQSFMDGEEKRYELKYILGRCQWQLYKI